MYLSKHNRHVSLFWDCIVPPIKLTFYCEFRIICGPENKQTNKKSLTWRSLLMESKNNFSFLCITTYKLLPSLEGLWLGFLSHFSDDRFQKCQWLTEGDMSTDGKNRTQTKSGISKANIPFNTLLTILFILLNKQRNICLLDPSSFYFM